MNIDLLEKRLQTLELQILPKECQQNETEITEGVTDLLLQTQTMIASALSCRDSITSILQKMNTINEYLDPTHAENELEVEAKRHYLLEVHPGLKDTIQLIGTFEKLTPMADSNNLKKVVEVSNKIEQLAVANLAIYENCRSITSNVLSLLKDYSDLMSTIRVLFAQLDSAVTDLERALEPKFVSEE